MPDPFSSVSRAGNPLPVRLSLWKGIGGVVLVVLLTVGALLLFRPLRPAIVIGPLPDGWPGSKISLADRVMGAMPIWLWRLRDSLMGPAKRISLRLTVVDCQGLSELELSALGRDANKFTAEDGKAGWLLPNSKLESLRQLVPQLSRAAIDTCHGVEAQLYAGESVPIDGAKRQTGLVVNVSPRVRRLSTDLRTIITFSGAVTNPITSIGDAANTQRVSVQTNLALSARVQIPRGSGVLLMNPYNSVIQKRLGGIISQEVAGK